MQFIPYHDKFVPDCKACQNVKGSLNPDFEASVKAFPENIELILGDCHKKLNRVACGCFSRICAASNDLGLTLKICNISESQGTLLMNALWEVAQIKTISKGSDRYTKPNQIHPQLIEATDRSYLFLWSASNPLINSPLAKPQLADPATLVRNQWQMALKGEGCDITFKTSDGEFKAHKSILCANSEHFKRLFSSNLKESSTGEVIMECSLQVLTLYMEFIYTNSIAALDSRKYDTQILFDILSISTMHQIEPLSELCLYHIHQYATPEEKAELLQTIGDIPHELTLYLILNWCENDPKLLSSLKIRLRTLSSEIVDHVHKIAASNNRRPLINVSSSIESFKSFFDVK